MGGGRHHNRERSGGGDLGVVGETHGGQVLAGKDRPGVDRLALREEVGMLASAGLFGGEPLKGAGVRPRVELDLEFTPAADVGQPQALAEDRIHRAEVPMQRRATAVGGEDVEAAGVEVERPAAGAVEAIGGATQQAARGEVGFEAKGDVLDARLIEIGVGMWVVGRHDQLRGTGVEDGARWAVQDSNLQPCA